LGRAVRPENSVLSGDVSAEPSSSRDPFETEYMVPEGTLLKREKSIQKYHWIMGGMAIVPLLASLAGIVLAGMGVVPWATALIPLIPAALFGLMWALFSVLRVHVTTEKLVVQLGPRGLHVPLGEIESARVVPRPRGRYSGGKVRMNLDGTKLYSFMMNPAPDLVVVEFERNGKRHTIELTSPDPHDLVRTILRAKAGVARPTARVEVEGELEEVEIARDGGVAARESDDR
jgi:hypothetical protein